MITNYWLSVETFEERLERLETPQKDYDDIVKIIEHLGLPKPDLDAFASATNKKCEYYLGKSYDSLNNDFLKGGSMIPETVYVQPPHKKYKDATIQCDKQYKKYGFTIVALMPSRNERTDYWHELIEPHRIECTNFGYIFYFPLQKAFKFEIDGKIATQKNGKPNVDANGYKLVFWVKKIYLKDFKKNLPAFYKWFYGQHEQTHA